MTNPGYFTWIIFSWGIIVGSVRTLPHVKKYQTVIPQRLKVSSYITDAATHQKYPDVLQYSLTIAGQNCTLHLERNKNLIGENFSVTHYLEQGTLQTTTPDLKAHCYYHGHIVGVEDSSASMELCSGIKGFVRLHDQVYLIEPLAGAGAAQAHGEEGLHAVYNYEHLRRKRSTCSHGNTTTFYDHGARPSGLFQLSSLRSRAQTKDYTGKPRTVELAVVIDKTEYKKFGSRRTIEARVLEIANHVDKLYRPVGVRVMLVSLDIWAYKDQIEVSTNPEQTLSRFLQWRQKSLLPRIKHDNAQFITGMDFEGSTVGLANTNAMCTSSSGAVNEDHNTNAVGVSSTIAHEMGHNLGLSHDTESCTCGSVTSKKGCIMAESVGLVYPELFSSCSQQQLSRFLEEVNPACLLDTPSTDRIYGGPVCGNAFLEPGEECDCGTALECKNPCCNATTCKLNARAQCAEGECCKNCQLKPTGSVCRAKAGDCDLEEYCNGLSASCPADAYTQNGLSCNSGMGYCYNGQCPSRQQHCKRLWGPDAEVAADVCFIQNRDCRKGPYNQRCSIQDLLDQFCGTLFCTGGWEFPVTSRKSIYEIGNFVCNEATMNPDDNYPAGLTMVPTGTKCGMNKVCYNQKCQDTRNIKEYEKTQCPAKCNNHGVCDHEGKCRCDAGWAPPYCELSDGSGLLAPLIAGPVVLFFLILKIFCCVTRRGSVTRFFQPASGQSNPVFRSGVVQGSPRLGSVTISHPTFVESSSAQVYRGFSAPVKPSPAVFNPSRAAPEASNNLQPKRLQQNVMPLRQPPTVPREPIYSGAKPLPPSRPLPPLASKPITKKPPPVPPAKPKPSLGLSMLPHTQLLAGRAALMPPSRPR